MSDRIKPEIILIPNPLGLDKAIQDIQVQLSSVSELNYIFGRARKNQLSQGNNVITVPETYRSKGKYINLLPNRDYSNYCFFFVNDPISFLSYEANDNEIKREARVSLIFWFTFDKINDKDYIQTEEIKESIYSVINQNSNVSLLQEFEDFNNVFNGFSLNEVQTKYFKFPYYGFRLDFTLFFQNKCD